MTKPLFHLDDLDVPLIYVSNGRKYMRKTISHNSLYSRLTKEEILQNINTEHGLKHKREDIFQLLKGVTPLCKIRSTYSDTVTLIGVVSFSENKSEDLVFYYRYFFCEENTLLDITSVADKSSEFFNRFMFGTLNEMIMYLRSDNTLENSEMYNTIRVLIDYNQKGIKDYDRPQRNLSLSNVFKLLKTSHNPLE